MRGRGPVVRLDRREKARMIELVIADFLGRPVEGLNTLDIGCGNGGISNHFAENNIHCSVDVADQRKPPMDAYEFRLTDDETIPYDDGQFDVVISNHVIEHVGDQLRHLSEILRVMAPRGCAYLATPNKSSPIMEGHVGNEMVLRYREMGPLFQSAGFALEEYGVRVAADPDRFNGEVAWAKNIPAPALKLLRPFFPSHIFMLTDAAETLVNAA